MAESGDSIAFRPLGSADIPLLARWLDDPEVGRWYDEGGSTLEYLTPLYAPVIAGDDPNRAFIVLIEGAAAGYVQAVPIDAFPAYAAQLRLEAGAVGIDLYIGEAAFRGRGLGALILSRFTEDVVFGLMRAPLAVIGPDPTNRRAVRCYEEAGFAWIKTVDVVDDDSPHNSGTEYLMIRRADDGFRTRPQYGG